MASGFIVSSRLFPAHAICAVLTAMSAIFLAMYARSILPSSHGNFYELYAIAAAVLGGFSLRGGEGSVIGVALGVILLQVLQNLVNLLGIPSSLNFAVSGSVILIGVLADQEYADSRERLRRLAAGGAAAPAEPAIHADDRIASSASMELSAAKDLQIPCMNGRARIIVADPFN